MTSEIRSEGREHYLGKSKQRNLGWLGWSRNMCET